MLVLIKCLRVLMSVFYFIEKSVFFPIRDRMVILQDPARRIIILQHSYKISHINLALSEAKLNKVIVQVNTHI